MKKRKLYPDYIYAPGDIVVEMIPGDEPFDDGPRPRRAGRRGIFIGNLQEYGHSSLIKVGEEEVVVTRRELSFAAGTDFKSPIFIKRHTNKEIKRLESLINNLRERYKKDLSDLKNAIKKARVALENK